MEKLTLQNPSCAQSLAPNKLLWAIFELGRVSALRGSATMITFSRWVLCLALGAGTWALAQDPGKSEDPPKNSKSDTPPANPKVDGKTEPAAPTDGKGETMPDGKGPGPEGKTVGPGRGIKPAIQLPGPDGKVTPPSVGLPSTVGYQPPPEVGGKLLRDWINELKSADPSLREQAIRAIASYGPAARESIPQIVERMNDRDSSPRMRAVLAIKYLDYYDKDIPKVVDGLAKRISEDPQASIRYEALLAMGRFGFREAGRNGLPAVLKAADDQSNWEIRRASFSILPRLGSDETGVDSRVYKALIHGAKDTAALARHEALIGLALLGKPNDATLATQMEKALVSVLNMRDVPSEIYARVALIGYNPVNDKIQIPLIIKHVKDSSFANRMVAIRAVSMLGPPAHEAVPDLVGYLNDRNPELVMSVFMAFTSMGPDAFRASDAIKAFLSKKEIPDNLRQAGTFALDAVNRRRSSSGSGVSGPAMPR
jgi:HEAT repeat protein